MSERKMRFFKKRKHNFNNSGFYNFLNSKICIMFAICLKDLINTRGYARGKRIVKALTVILLLANNLFKHIFFSFAICSFNLF